MSRMGMTAAYALGLLRQTGEGDRPELERAEALLQVDWLTKEDGSHPTVTEAIEWLGTLDPDFDIVNGSSK